MRVLMICPELPSEQRPGTMAPGARQIESIKQAGIATEVVDMRGIPKLKYLQMIPRIVKAARKVDLIHAHFGYCGWLGLIGRKLSRRKIPIAISFMGSDLLGTPYNERGDLERMSIYEVSCNIRLATKYDQVIVKSREMAAKIPHVASHVIPNGIDLKKFQPLNRVSACEQLGLNPQQINILFPGNPDNPRKGFELATSAIKIAGQILESPINLIPLRKVPPDLVPIYMNACHAMVMTSVFEGSPNVVKEAMACNVCVVGVPVGDVHELLDGVAGCYRTTRDPAEIASALVAILQRNQASNGREILVSRGLSLEGVADRIIAVYQQAIDGQTAFGK